MDLSSHSPLWVGDSIECHLWTALPSQDHFHTSLPVMDISQLAYCSLKHMPPILLLGQKSDSEQRRNYCITNMWENYRLSLFS